MAVIERVIRGRVMRGLCPQLMDCEDCELVEDESGADDDSGYVSG